MTGIAGRMSPQERQCHVLLTDRRGLSLLKSTDRAFLLMVHDRIMARLNGLPVGSIQIHGDAGAHNVLITPGGALYVDFENVCRGPREWDIGWLGDIDLARFEPVSRDLLLTDLRSLCVSVWCWARYDIAEKREAAEVHLAYLRTQYTRPPRSQPSDTPARAANKIVAAMARAPAATLSTENINNGAIRKERGMNIA